MPAYDFEMRAAEAEGVKVEFLTSPVRIESDGSALKLWLQRMRLEQADASGRAAVQPVSGSDYAIAADTVMAAIGQTTGVSDAWGLTRRADGTIAVSEGSLKTSREGVFAGGDVVLGPLNVIEAIAQGRKAAQEIDRYLGGSGDIAEILAPDAGEEMNYHPDIHPQGKGCVSMSELSPRSRSHGFELAERGYTEAEAAEEARRCVRCDLWSVKAAPEIWWRSRGLKPYWLGGEDRMGREKDSAKARTHAPYAPAYDHAPYIPHEYSPKE